MTIHPQPEMAPKLIRAQRRSLGARSLRVFAGIYLTKHLSNAPSKLHLDLMDILEDVSVCRGARVAVAAPRDHAKTTILGLCYVLWCICYEKEKYIVFISNTAKLANGMLANVKAELESNPRLLSDFPNACQEPGSKPKPGRWTKDEIITRNGVQVRAFGAEGKIRGVKHRENRPSLIILDDMEDEEQVSSPERREKLDNWFKKAVLKVGNRRTNVIVVGTIMHYDSLLARLLDPRKSPGWRASKYQAVISWSSRMDLWGEWEGIYCRTKEFERAAGPDAAMA